MSSAPHEEQGFSLRARVGSALCAGVLAAAIAALPAAFRSTGDGVALGLAWLAIGAWLTVPATLGIALVRGARDGWRAAAGARGAAVAWTVCAWFMASFIALTMLGAWLRATTHHHGLAGVTFAIAGLGAIAGLALVVGRVGSMAEHAEALTRSAIPGFSLVLLAVIAAAIVLRAAQTATGAPLAPATGEALLDALAFAIGVGLLSRNELAQVAWMARAGVPMALGVVALGASVLARDARLRASVCSHVPSVAALVGAADD